MVTPGTFESNGIVELVFSWGFEGEKEMSCWRRVSEGWLNEREGQQCKKEEKREEEEEKEKAGVSWVLFITSRSGQSDTLSIRIG